MYFCIILYCTTGTMHCISNGIICQYKYIGIAHKLNHGFIRHHQLCWLICQTTHVNAWVKQHCVKFFTQEDSSVNKISLLVKPCNTTESHGHWCQAWVNLVLVCFTTGTFCCSKPHRQFLSELFTFQSMKNNLCLRAHTHTHTHTHSHRGTLQLMKRPVFSLEHTHTHTHTHTHIEEHSSLWSAQSSFWNTHTHTPYYFTHTHTHTHTHTPLCLPRVKYQGQRCVFLYVLKLP